MIVIVSGGRHYEDPNGDLARVLDELQPYLVVHGGASGADEVAARWAQAREVDCLRVPAKWKQYGKAAGPKRNEQMMSIAQGLAGGADLVHVLAPGGAGTQHAASVSRRLGIRQVLVGGEA